MKARFDEWVAMGTPHHCFMCYELRAASQPQTALLEDRGACQAGHKGGRHWDLLFFPDLPSKNIETKEKRIVTTY